MNARERLTALISTHEGLVLRCYDDATGELIRPGSHVLGHPTIGYGTALDTRGITKAQAQRLRDEALDDVEHGLRLQFRGYDALNEPRRMALLELAYQLGVGGLLGFPKMLRAIRNEDWPEAGIELVDSEWARQTQPSRVACLHRMLVDGIWPDGDGPS